MKSIVYGNANEYFSEDEREKFLKIPHSVQILADGINLINFKVDNYKVSNTKLLQLIKPFNTSMFENDALDSYLFKLNLVSGDKGVFIVANSAEAVEHLLKELMKHDEEEVKQFNYYAESCCNGYEIVTSQSRMVKQIAQMKMYLTENDIKVNEYPVDYLTLSNLPEDEQEKEYYKLRDKYGEGYRFQAYNDLDYTPFIHNGELYIYDSSGARLFIVKGTDVDYKIYQISRDWDDVTDFGDWFNEFLWDHMQGHIINGKNVNEYHLIGEVKDGKVVKATPSLTDFDLINSFIVHELIEDGKIKEDTPKFLSFKQLLENYTIQKEVYRISTRAFPELMKSLKVVNGVLTYAGFSQIDNDKLGTSEEDYTYFNTDELEKSLEKSAQLLADLSKNYKEQIKAYVDEQKEKYPGDKTSRMVELVSIYLEKSVNKTNKLK